MDKVVTEFQGLESRGLEDDTQTRYRISESGQKKKMKMTGRR